ncbi:MULTISPECIES: GNAT family N-acetyltransferase [unclassified Paraburkholderia]|uniref:GNAT family N-acetyltransferase n=1 Tax=unclassified Paraburkholderia TaxID=2615204 RepID=UPI002AB7C8B2|nr:MULTISPECIES: GNAT family N-acetyltransferase [unclassified Paraburkholderia]
MTPIHSELAVITDTASSVGTVNPSERSRTELQRSSVRGVARQSYIVTPLGEWFREDVLAHLLSLDASSRTLRFGDAVRDYTIKAYVDAMDFARDIVLGAHNTHLNLLAVGHLVFSGEAGQPPPVAELGLSVRCESRGRGIGTAIFRSALEIARARGARTFSMHFSVENAAMLHIAHRAGMTPSYQYGEFHGELDLRPCVTPSTPPTSHPRT